MEKILNTWRTTEDKAVFYDDWQLQPIKSYKDVKAYSNNGISVVIVKDNVSIMEVVSIHNRHKELLKAIHENDTSYGFIVDRANDSYQKGMKYKKIHKLN